jgi:hypothetical protein
VYFNLNYFTQFFQIQRLFIRFKLLTQVSKDITPTSRILEERNQIQAANQICALSKRRQSAANVASNTETRQLYYVIRISWARFRVICGCDVLMHKQLKLVLNVQVFYLENGSQILTVNMLQAGCDI